MTRYVILRKVDEADSYLEIGESEAPNDMAAVKDFLAKDDNGENFGEGFYRAVPKRSWPDEPHPIAKKISFG